MKKTLRKIFLISVISFSSLMHGEYLKAQEGLEFVVLATQNPEEAGARVFRLKDGDPLESGGGFRTDTFSWSAWYSANGSDNIAPQPPSGISAGDIVGDDGTDGIQINWSASYDEPAMAGVKDVLGYYIMAATTELEWANIVNKSVNTNNIIDITGGPIQ